MSRIFTMSFASVYRLYIAKVEKKGRTQAELDEVIRWLSGYDEATLEAHITSGTNFQDFFAQAKLHPKALQHHRSGVRGAGRSRRRPADAEDPVPRQTRGRASKGKGDAEGVAQLSGPR